MADIEIGTRVHVLGRTSPASGRLGTVMLVTRAGDGFLVETDEPFPAAPGVPADHGTPAVRRRAWCADDELVVAGEAVRRFAAPPQVRRFDPPSDLAAARHSVRGQIGSAAFGDLLTAGRPIPSVPRSHGG